MKTYNSKYFGILKDIKENFININIFKEIIKHDLFEKRLLSDCYLGEDYFGLEIESQEFKCDFNDFFLYNKSEYHLKKEIWNDMFQLNAYQIELFHQMSDFDLNDVKIQLQYLITKDEKIHFLNKLNSDFLDCIKEKDYLTLYLQKDAVNGYKDWEDYYYNNQIEEDNFQNVFMFLKGNEDFYPEKTNKLWREYLVYKEIRDFIEKTCLLLNDNSKQVIDNRKNEYKDIRKDIFKDENSRMIFDFIIEKWHGKKNTSFYSMLYKYLQIEKKIIILDNDSLTYRNFIIGNYNLKSFAKIQRQTSENENTRWDLVFKSFKDISSNFTHLSE